MKKLLLVMSVVVLLDGSLSCKKPTPPTATVDTPTHVVDSVLIREKIIGEWTVKTVMMNYWKNGIHDYKQEWIDPDGYFINDKEQPLIWKESLRTFINFNQNGTFSIYHHDNDSNTVDTNGYITSVFMPAFGNWELNGETSKFTNHYWAYDTIWECGYVEYSNGITLFGMAAAKNYWLDSIMIGDTAWIYFQRIDSTKLFK